MKQYSIIILLLFFLVCSSGISSGVVWFSSRSDRNYVFIRGGNENLSTIYQADLQRLYPTDTTCSAISSTGLSLVDRVVNAKDTNPLWRKLLFPEHPADNRTLWKESSGNGQLYARVYSAVGVVGANLLINLSGDNGTTFYRNITLNAVGFYPILTQGYDTCRSRNWTNSAYRISTYTGARFTLSINQSRAGILWRFGSRQGNDNPNNGQFALNAGNLQIGTSNIMGNFSMDNDSLWFTCMENWTGKTIGGYALYVLNGGLRVNNSDLYFDNNMASADTTTIAYSTSTKPIIITFSHVRSEGKGYFNLPSGVTTFINNTVWERMSLWNGRLYLRDTTFVGHGSGYSMYNCNLISSDAIFFTNYTSALAHKSQNWNVSNSIVDRCTYLFKAVNADKRGRFLDCTVNTYTIDPVSTWTSSTAWVNRSTTLRVQVMNGSTPVSGARVRYWNSTMVKILDTTTAASGFISPVVIECMRWPGGNTPTWMSPGTLNISSGGWCSNFSINLSRYGVGGCNLTIGNCSTTVGGGGATVYIPLNNNGDGTLWLTLGLVGGTLFGVVPLVRMKRKD